MKKSKLLLVLSTAAMMSLASCSGSEGPMGPAGPQGAKGDKGSDGVSITSVVKTGTSGLEDTYTITFSDGNSTTFKIVNGEDGNDGDDGHTPQISINQEGYWCVDGTSLGVKAKGDKGDSGADGISIVGVQLTSSVGLVDTYTITYSNSETSTFTVTNGEKGDKGDAGVSIVSVAFKSSSGLEDTYTITFSDGNTTDFVIKNGEDGEDGDTPEITINEDGYWCVDGTSLGVKAKGDKGDAGDDGVSIVSVVKTSSEGLVDTYTITYSNSETSTFTVTNGEKGEKGDPGETAWSNTILPVTGGYVVPSIGSGVVGEEITFTAFAAEDYTATALFLNGEQVILDENGQYTTTMVEHGFVVQGIFVRSNIVPQGADATEIQEYLDSLEAGSTVKFKYDHVLNKRVTLNKDLTIVGGGVVSGIDKGSFGVAEGVNATFQGFKFGTFHNDTNNLSPVYAQKLTSKVVFDSCTFDEADWDSIQLVPTASTAEIVIKNCEFNILATQKHVIHIEPTKTGPTDLVGLEIVGNTFNGADAFGGDLICITRVTNINSALKAGDNVFDDELKLQVPPTYEGNVYVADPSGLETTFLVDSLTSEVSDDKQYFSEEIYLPETGDVSALSSFLAKVPEGSTVVFKKSVSLTGGLRIEKDLTVKCANENVVISSEVGSFYVGSENNVVFENMNFGSFTNAKGESSIVYAQQMKGSVVFDSCTFGYAEWDSLQLLPVEDNVSIKITNCVFNINPAQKRAIHIQPNALHEFTELEISGNTFNGADEFGGDLICINKVSNIESVLKVGKNVSDKEFKLQTPPSYEGNVYLADNAQGEVRFKVEALSGAEIVSGANAFAKHGEIEADPLSTDEAYALAESLGSGGATTEQYYVEGYVTKIETAYSSQFGNITLQFTTSADKIFKLYRATCTAEEADKIEVGTYVEVHGIIKNYSGTMETDAGAAIVKIENKLAKLEISGHEQLQIEDTATYTVTGSPASADLGTVTWSIDSGADYISLPETKTGTSIEVTGVAEGTAVLKATSGSISNTFNIEVTDQAVVDPYEIIFADHKSGSNTNYKTNYDVTIDNITWSLPGNQQNGLAIGGGKNETVGDLTRYFFNKTAFENEVSSIEIAYGSRDSVVTVNSVMLEVYSSVEDAASGTGAIETIAGSYVDNGKTTFTKPSSSDWKGKYFKVVYSLTTTDLKNNKKVVIDSLKVSF